MPRVFPAKVSWWLFGPILALLLGITGRMIYDKLWLVLLPLAGVYVLVFSILLHTRYTLTGDELLIRCSFLSWHVPVQHITRIRPTHNPLSSPAPSLDRLEITYNRYDQILISPRDKAGLVAALQQLNPNIQVHAL